MRLNVNTNRLFLPSSADINPFQGLRPAAAAHQSKQLTNRIKSKRHQLDGRSISHSQHNEKHLQCLISKTFKNFKLKQKTKSASEATNGCVCLFV